MTAIEHASTKPSVALIPAGNVVLTGDLHLPKDPVGVVLFAHGSGSSRLSPRNQFVAKRLQAGGLATLLFDLLTPTEEALDRQSACLRFDIEFLAQRLIHASEWVLTQTATRQLAPGYFAASTGAAAALVAASRLGVAVQGIVSRGGRPDLAGEALRRVSAPTLLIVGGLDEQVIDLNRVAYAELSCIKDLQIVPGATHLFDEPGTLEQVADRALTWLQTYLRARAQDSSRQSGDNIQNVATDDLA
jgi:putative phosphoribosyl transferase